MKAIATNSFHAWILAARPKTLTGAVIPVLTGSALAFADEAFNIIPALLCALSVSYTHLSMSTASIS